MWLENQKYKEIQTALHSGEQQRLDRILVDLLRREKKIHDSPQRCPVCHKPLTRQTLPYFEFFVTACPDFHGLWMSPEITKKLRDFIVEQISASAKKGQHARFFQRAAIIFIAIFLLIYGPLAIVKTYQSALNQLDGQRVGENYWPQVQSDRYVALPRQVVVFNENEQLYFEQLVGVLESGISNQLNMRRGIEVKRSPQEYSDLFRVYRRNQTAFIERLKSMPLPEQLASFHDSLMNAAEHQLIFHAAWTDAKIEDASIGFREMLGHASLGQLTVDLLKAYETFLALYPEMDSQTHRAIKKRLGSMDIR